jgi:hypothetical protein
VPNERLHACMGTVAWGAPRTLRVLPGTQVQVVEAQCRKLFLRRMFFQVGFSRMANSADQVQVDAQCRKLFK